MTPQWAGLVLAALTFGTIALGHVVVRKINYRYGTKTGPLGLCTGTGVLCPVAVGREQPGLGRPGDLGYDDHLGWN
jgi:hypothetical protein